MAVDVAGIIDDVLFRSHQDISSPEFTARARVLRILNDMLIDLTENTKIFQKTDEIELVSGTRSYSLASDIYSVEWVSYDNEPLWPTTVPALDMWSSTWREDQGNVTHWLRGYEGMHKLSFYELPGDSDDGQVVTYGLVYYETDLTDSTSVYLPEPIANARNMALDWCLGQLFGLRREVEDRAKGQEHLARYYAARNKFDAWARETSRVYVIGSEPRDLRVKLGRLPDTYPEGYW